LKPILPVMSLPMPCAASVSAALTPGTACRGGAGVGHHKDVTAVGINYQEIKVSAESRLYAVFNVISICGESNFQNAPLTAGSACDEEARHVCTHF
jgi:hypothetical protein